MKKLFVKYKTTIVQFLKVNLIGIINSLLDWAVFALLNGVFHMHRFIAAPISYSCGIANSFILNKLWAFKKQKQDFKGLELVKFVITNLVSLCVKMLIIELGKTVFGINESIGNIMATPFIFIINFALYKFWVFKALEK